MAPSPRPTRWPRFGLAERLLWLGVALLALGSQGVQRLWRAVDREVWVTAEAYGPSDMDPWFMPTVMAGTGHVWGEYHGARAAAAARAVESWRAHPTRESEAQGWAERWEEARQAELINAEALRDAPPSTGPTFEFSLGPDRKNDLGAGDDVRVILGSSRYHLYLDAPSLALVLAGLLGTGLALARWAPRAASTRGEVLVSLAVSATTLALHLGGRLAWQAYGPQDSFHAFPLAVVLALEQAGFAPRLAGPEATLASSLLLVVVVVVALVRLEQARAARAVAGSQPTSRGPRP